MLRLSPCLFVGEHVVHRLAVRQSVVPAVEPEVCEADGSDIPLIVGHHGATGVAAVGMVFAWCMQMHNVAVSYNVSSLVGWRAVLTHDSRP